MGYAIPEASQLWKGPDSQAVRLVKYDFREYYKRVMDASRAKYRFGALSHISAEAIGVPGERTFRLIVESGAASATIWLEKEQLQQLGTYIKEIGESLSRNDSAGETQTPEPGWDGGAASLDFKVGKLALGHDASTNAFLLIAHDIEEEDEEIATVSFWLTMKQSEELADEALKVCAAGRPRCFLCGQPMNRDGHICPRANGHARLGA